MMLAHLILAATPLTDITCTDEQGKVVYQRMNVYVEIGRGDSFDVRVPGQPTVEKTVGSCKVVMSQPPKEKTDVASH